MTQYQGPPASAGTCKQQALLSSTGSCSFNPLTLRFAGNDLERAYISSWCEKQFMLDRVGCWVSLLQLTAGIAYIIIRRPPMLATSRVLLVGSGLLHGLHAVLINSHSYRQHRNAMIMVLLALLRFLTAATVFHVESVSSTATRVFYKTGIIPLCWYCVSLPLPFRQQVLAQLLAVVLYQATLGVMACQELSSETQLMQLLAAAWNNLRQWLALMLQVQGLNLTPMRATAAHMEVAPLLPCWSTITLLLLLTGLVLPAPVWYSMELRSRTRFYTKWQQQQRQQWQRWQLQQQELAGCSSSTTSAAELPPAAGLDGRDLARPGAGAWPSGAGFSAAGLGGLSAVPVDGGSEFDVPVLYLFVSVAVVCICSCLLLLSYGPHLLHLQLQLLQLSPLEVYKGLE